LRFAWLRKRKQVDTMWAGGSQGVTNLPWGWEEIAPFGVCCDNHQVAEMSGNRKWKVTVRAFWGCNEEQI
jgi:hypothetical protein